MGVPVVKPSGPNFYDSLEKASTVGELVDFLKKAMENEEKVKNTQVYVTDCGIYTDLVTVSEYDDEVIITEFGYSNDDKYTSDKMTVEMLYNILCEMPREKTLHACVDGQYYGGKNEGVMMDIWDNNRAIINWTCWKSA